MSAGQTTITYGDLKILNCLTREFRQEAVYDPSGADLMYFRFTVRVVGYLTGRSASSSYTPTTQVLPTSGDGSAGHHLWSLRYLLAPRRQFEMRVGATISGGGDISGGTVLLQAQSLDRGADGKNATNRDVDNGPKARLIDVTEIAGDNLIRAEFEFEICKVECDSLGNCGNISGVLSNRWTVVDDVDHNFMTTRSFSGRLRAVSSRTNVNSFRSLVVPPLQPGMRRDSMRFSASEDGLWLAYDVVDREVAFSPPSPATTWKFQHTERIEREGQLGFFSEVSVTLGGDRYVDKKLLIQIAAAIAEAKILQKANPDGCFLQSLTITDEYGDDSSLVHVHAVGRRTADAGAMFGIATARIGKPIDATDLSAVVANYDRNFSRGARQGEKLEVEGPISLVGAFAAYLQSPCSGTHSLFASVDGTESDAPQQRQSSTLQADVVGEIPDDGSLGSYNDGATSAMYLFYQMESKYQTDSITAHLPVAVPTSLGGDPLSGSKSSAFVNLAAGLTRRVIRLNAERVGAWPTLPNPGRSFTDSNGILNRLLRSSRLPGTGDITADNKRIYRLAAEYVYGMEREPFDSEPLVAGVNSWEQSAGLYSLAFPTITEEQIAVGGRA